MRGTRNRKDVGPLTHGEVVPAASDSSAGDDSLRLLFENSLDALILSDDEGNFLKFNPPVREIFGRTAEQMRDLHFRDLAPPESSDAAEQYLQYIQTGRRAGEFVLKRPDGEYRIIVFSACRLAAGQHLTILRDVTEFRHAEAALRESAAWYRHLADAMPQIVWTARPDGYLDYYNERWYEFTGRPRGDGGDSSWEPILHPEDVAHCRETWYRSVRSGERYEIEYRFKDRATGGYRWFLGRAVPVKDASGAILKWFGTCTDINEQKIAENEIAALNERLRRSVQETHHRVKNNLQVISALVDLQVESDSETVSAAAMLRIGQHTRSLAAIHDLLTQHVKTDAQADSISTLQALRRLIPLLQATTGGREIRYKVDEVWLPVQTGATLALLVSELVSNAVKHGRGDIELVLSVVDAVARLEVNDDGPGFPPAFDWETAANTGLALIQSAGCHELCGQVAYENRPEGGARVVVTFPLMYAFTNPPRDAAPTINP